MWLTVDDLLADWIGTDAPYGQEDTIGRWIGRAERMIRREFPSIQARIDSGGEPDLLETVRDVVSAMVTRVFRNPEGIRQRQETDGSFTGSITFAGDMPGGLFLSDSERDALREPGSTGSGAAYSITVSGKDTGRHYPWCDRTWARDSCSCGTDIAGYPIYEAGDCSCVG
ncbi:hypothetical protein [Trueperella sp. LYQ141]|uniref:hypothetical protein n=1 Tax=Trueperella sp. LYQ141 TaxID=3391058 RepID=UPI0039830A86